ncbi:MAG: hypothetical protein LBV45_06980, partial [Xanthomonadaceae bacterium]|nr:hypothetical protein [Xanthomonadaceae bacterium]
MTNSFEHDAGKAECRLTVRSSQPAAPRSPSKVNQGLSMLKSIWSACANRATALVALGMLTLSGMSSAQAAPTITPTGPTYSCNALYAVNAQGVVGTYPGAIDIGVWKIMDYTGGTPTLLNPAELVYKAASFDDWVATGIGGQTLAIGYRGGEGNGPLAMYSWGIDSNDYQYMYYVLGDGAATQAIKLPPMGAFPTPAGISAFPSGEVYQKTGEVFLAGPQSGSNTALRIRRYNPVTGAIIDSGQILPEHSSDAGMVGFQGDMAIDAEGSIYMLALDRVGGNPWLVRIKPGGNGSGWTYNKVFQISGISFSTSAVDYQAIYGMAFLGGKLFVAQGTDIFQIDLFTHLATRVGTPPITDYDGVRLYDLASCQTAPVIKGKVYNDADADGVISGSESGVAGVTVELYKAGSNTPVTVQQTSGGGEYTFIVDDYNATYYVRL